MLTPRFSLDQCEDHLTVKIYAPFTNVADTEVFFDEQDFRFYSRPYFLRLHLPAQVQETDDATAHYDADSKSFVVTVPKKVKGEHFPGLEMISDLLIPKGDTKLPNGPMVEVLGECNAESDPEVNCYFEQKVPGNPEDGDIQPLKADGYGFAFKQTGVFSRLLGECQHLFEIQDLDGKSFKDRRLERVEKESLSFNSDHFLADLHDPPDTLVHCLRLPHPHERSEDGVLRPLTKDERERMVQLATSKRKHPLELSPSDQLSVCYGMLDILYAYSYETRVNLFDVEEDLGPESGWTIQKLASTLSCGERFTNLKQVVVATLRRTLCYPLFRHYQLGLKVWSDVSSHLLPHREEIVKVFLRLIPQFVDENYGHLFNQLYIEDYAVWSQSSLTDEILGDLKIALDVILESVRKSDLRLELDELELAAKVTIEEANSSVKEEERDVERQLEKLSIAKVEDSDDSDTEDSSSDSDSESDSSNSGSDSDDSSDLSSSSSGSDTVITETNEE